MKKILAILTGAALALSCNGLLDMTPRGSVSAKTMWESTKNAEYSINHLYSYIFSFSANPAPNLGLTEALTDELKYTTYNFNAMALVPSYIAYYESTVTTGTIDVYLGMWGPLYVAVRETNEGLNYLKSYGQMSDGDKTRLEAELRFLRAFFYFELAKRYKDVILYDEDLSKISKDKALSPESEVWDFIQADLEFAATNLPTQGAAGGRIDRGMAYAFTTRAMLYAKRYDAVIAAADKVKELGYALESDYADSYSKPLASGNKEAILQYTFSSANNIVHDFNFYYTPGGDYVVEESTGGAYAVPTQELVESYELAETGGFPNWNPWHGSTTVTPPYTSLEPRFQATILYNGSKWKNRTIEPYIGGTDGWAFWKKEKKPDGRTVTGYYMKKLVDETYDVNTSGSSQPFTFLRYGEVLLNRAEACYFISDEVGANDAVREIRGRVGLPYTDKSADNLFKAIIQERKVELAFEGQRYWDLRRWNLAARNYPEGLSGYQQHGLRIEKTGEDSFRYTYVSVDEKNRNFPERLYRLPMPESELSSNSLVEQYDEWK